MGSNQQGFWEMRQHSLEMLGAEAQVRRHLPGPCGEKDGRDLEGEGAKIDCSLQQSVSKGFIPEWSSSGGDATLGSNGGTEFPETEDQRGCHLAKMT